MTFYNRIGNPAYYNDFDESSAAWLRELIKRGLIAPGEVDSRSILDVSADDLSGFTQCHFFAGIGGWSYALRLAGWPDDRPVWTGSPPCQPFSAAGRQEGRKDERHLAPHFVDLVRAGRPGMLFGEQVASAEVFGKAAKPSRRNSAEPPQWAWIDDLSDRLEAARYAVGANDFPSAGIGAPHIRQRTFFGAVAHEWMDVADCAGQQAVGSGPLRDRNEPEAILRGATGGMGDGFGTGLEEHGRDGDNRHEPGRNRADAAGPVAPAGATYELGAAGPWKSYADWFGVCWHDECRNSDRGFCDCPDRGAPAGWHWCEHDGWLADADGRDARAERQQRSGEQRQQPQDGGDGGLADSELQQRQITSSGPDAARGRDQEPAEVAGLRRNSRPGPTNGFWADADWLFCRDGKWRPVEPGLKPLAHGVSGRVGLLRGYGNAINPHAAAQFIEAFYEAAGLRHLRLTAVSEMTTDKGIFG